MSNLTFVGNLFGSYPRVLRSSLGSLTEANRAKGRNNGTPCPGVPRSLFGSYPRVFGSPPSSLTEANRAKVGATVPRALEYRGASLGAIPGSLGPHPALARTKQNDFPVGGLATQRERNVEAKPLSLTHLSVLTFHNLGMAFPQQALCTTEGLGEGYLGPPP